MANEITVYYVNTSYSPASYDLQGDAEFEFTTGGVVTDSKNNDYVVDSVKIESPNFAGHIKMTPASPSGSALQLTYVRVADQVTSAVGGHIERVAVSGNVVRYEFGPPTTTNNEVTWDFSPATPPLTLTVKVKRV